MTLLDFGLNTQPENEEEKETETERNLSSDEIFNSIKKLIIFLGLT